MMAREYRGMWIPVEIEENPNLNPTEIMLLMKIHYLDNSENHCYASNNYFAEKLKQSERTISRAIAHLIELHYISQVSFNGRTRVLKSNLITAIETETGLTKIECPKIDDGEADQTNCLGRPENLSEQTRKIVLTDQPNCLTNINSNSKKNIYKNREENITTINPIGFSSSGTENAFGTRYDTLVNKKKNKSYHEIIEEYTNNPDFRNLLEEYYEVWKVVGLEHNKQPLPNVFKGFLRQLDRDGKDEDERMEIVEYCMAARRHYSLPYSEMKERQSNPKKFSQQKSNISKGFNQSMTNEELEEYRKQQEEWRNEMEQKGIQIKF